VVRSPDVRALLLDLDETLYPRDNGVLRRVDRRINSFMTERLGIDPGEVDAVRIRLRDGFGTTMRGLMESYPIDPDEYLGHCHGVDLSDLLAADAELRALLLRLPQRKLVFTNAPRAHARQVLDLLGIADVFEAVLALEDLAYDPKPAATAYGAALQRVALPAADCVFVDDTHANVAAAARQGMRGVWLAPRHAPRPAPASDGVQHVVTSLHELESILADAGG
jgi:putative hydrolase of the HAD superfamily